MIIAGGYIEIKRQIVDLTYLNKTNPLARKCWRFQVSFLHFWSRRSSDFYERSWLLSKIYWNRMSDFGLLVSHGQKKKLLVSSKNKMPFPSQLPSLRLINAELKPYKTDLESVWPGPQSSLFRCQKRASNLDDFSHRIYQLGEFQLPSDMKNYIPLGRIYRLCVFSYLVLP